MAQAVISLHHGIVTDTNNHCNLQGTPTHYGTYRFWTVLQKSTISTCGSPSYPKSRTSIIS